MKSLDLESTPLQHDSSIIFTVDDAYRLRWCNLAWDRFALANGGSHLVRSEVRGRVLFDYVSGPLAAYYRDAFERVRSTGAAWRHEYECSSSHHRRKFAMTVYPAAGGLLVVNSLHTEEPRPNSTAPADESQYRTANGLLVMCSNCRRTRRAIGGEIWDWVPAFVLSPRDSVSHGLCPPCAECYIVDWTGDPPPVTSD